VQNERGAVLLVGGSVYVAFGGHWGDCGDYHGWVVGVPTSGPAGAKAYATPARGAGMWGPGGPASEGTDVFVTTGNSIGASTWGGGEAVLRLHAGPVFSGNAGDYFAPQDWQGLDNSDTDIGGSGALVIDAAGFTPSKVVLALGKDGNAYLVDRTNLGGIGAGLGKLQVANGEIINAAASYTLGGATYVVAHGYGGAQGHGCPNGGAGDLFAFKLDANAPAKMSMVWCTDNGGQGSPIVTTSNGQNDALVWTFGAEATGKLHAFDALTGAQVFAGGGTADQTKGVRRFTTPIAVHGRIWIGADNRLASYIVQ
jgi:hypothetical protein